MSSVLQTISRLLGVMLTCVFVACNSINKEVKEVMDSTDSKQQKTLVTFIEHYRGGEHLGIAKFLVANIKNKHSIEGGNYIAYQAYLDSIGTTEQTVNNRKNYDYRGYLSSLPTNRRYTNVLDLSVLNADSLIQQTDAALRIWSQTSWANLYSMEVFKQFIVPYRIADEPLEYGWRTDAYERHKHLLQEQKDSSLVAICSFIYQYLDFQTNNLFWGEPLQSYSANVKYKQGTCNDYAVYTAMVMRSLGIPTSLDFVPYWGDGNNGHSFNSLLLPDGTCRGYDNAEDILSGLTLSGKVPKIYRKVYEIQRNSLLYKYRDTEYIPNVFAHYNLVDVTECYNIPLSDVVVLPELNKPQSKIVYLSVFSPREWRPVAWTEYVDGRAFFHRVGVGYTMDEQACDKGENYGEGCLFLPVSYVNEKVLPLHYPFILTQKAAPRYLTPEKENREKVVLLRKYPRRKRIIEFAKNMQGGYFELSNDRNFYQSTLIYFVDSISASHLQTIPILERNKYRYMRFYKRAGGVSVGEIGCLDGQNRVIPGKLLVDKILMGDSDLKNISDGNPLSFFDVGNLKDSWVGLDFGKPMKLSALFFCPRTDANDISPGDEYELFYWDRIWVSLGRQIAKEYSLTYTDVPKNALLWLRNLTKGVEERPFTYENSAQIWW